jgi:hypothetical protein
MSFALSYARTQPLGDRQLATLRRIAHDAPHSLASEAEAEYLLAAVGPLLDELAARRSWMAVHATAIDLTNVIVLPAVR